MNAALEPGALPKLRSVPHQFSLRALSIDAASANGCSADLGPARPTADHGPSNGRFSPTVTVLTRSPSLFGHRPALANSINVESPVGSSVKYRSAVLQQRGSSLTVRFRRLQTLIRFMFDMHMVSVSTVADASMREAATTSSRSDAGTAPGGSRSEEAAV